MTIEPDAGLLYDHLEHFLGKVNNTWKVPGQEQFEIFEFLEKPEKNLKVLVSLGLFQHSFQLRNQTQGSVNVEISVVVGSLIESKRIAAMMVSVGKELLRTHMFPGMHQIFLGEGPVLVGGNPLFEHFYLSYPKDFPTTFATCRTTISPIGIVQLIPISERERKFILENGGGEFEELVHQKGLDLSAFDNRTEAV